MSHLIKNNKLEHYQLMAKLCMYIGPVFVILSVLSGLGYNHYTNKVKEVKEQLSVAKSDQRKGVIIDYSSKKVTIVRINWENQSFNGSLGLLIYDVNIVNISAESITIKDVLLEFDLDGKHYTEQALNLITGIVHSKLKKEAIPSIYLMPNKKDQMFYLGWYNIRDQILKGNLLQPGAILKGSACYLLHITKPLDMNKIKNLRIKVIDFTGNINTNEIEFEDNTEIRVLELKQIYFESKE